MYSFTLPNTFPQIMPAFIEISKGSNIKYEWDEENKVLTLDRILHSSVVYPENYGFIPACIHLVLQHYYKERVFPNTIRQATDSFKAASQSSDAAHFQGASS